MQKHKTKIIIAVVVLVALAGAWFLGYTPTTAPETPFVVAAAETSDTNSLAGAVASLTDTDATPVSPQDSSGESETANVDDVEVSDTPSAEADAQTGQIEFPDDSQAETDVSADESSDAGTQAEEAGETDIHADAPGEADTQAEEPGEVAPPQTSDVSGQTESTETPAAPSTETDNQAESPETPAPPLTEPVNSPSELPPPIVNEPAESEPVSAIADDGSFTVTLSVRVDTILPFMPLLHRDKHELVPADGVIFPPTQVTAYEGESVFNVLQREMRRNRIHMSSRFTPIFNSAYVEAINNLFEFDVGPRSGWLYRVNGVFPNFGSSLYTLSPGDVIEWMYTVDLGRDVGATWIEEFQR